MALAILPLCRAQNYISKDRIHLWFAFIQLPLAMMLNLQMTRPNNASELKVKICVTFMNKGLMVTKVRTSRTAQLLT